MVHWKEVSHIYDSYRRPPSRRQRRRRLKFIVAITAISGIGFLATLAHHSTSPHQPIFSKPAAAESAKPAPFKVSPQWPEHVAAAAVGIKGYGPIATYGEEGQRPTASIAKVITALAILEKKPLKIGQEGPRIPITARDEQRYHDYVAQNGSVAEVQAGVPITERQALAAMLLPSANNIADTTAVWAFGSLANYQAYANEMLQRKGLAHTVVGGDASGLDPKTKSTTRDLVKLGELALENPVIAEIVAQHDTGYFPVTGALPNYNRLVTSHGYSGIKLGDSNEAGITLLFSTRFEYAGKPYDLIGVVLGAHSDYQPQESAYQFMESVKASAHN